jgi:DNA (cytosine-5)-methyltransferase 1
VICLKTGNSLTENVAVLKVTHELLKEGNVRVGKYCGDFIPQDTVGTSNRKKGIGKTIDIRLSGLDITVKTDIPEDKKIFRRRTEIREFAKHHNLQLGDKIYLERLNRRVFRLRPSTKQFTFIDLFAGIGGMRLAFEKAGGKCVFSSEWDESACKTYETNFGEKPQGDILKIPSSEIPDHDILLAGFPCQPFSISGVSKKNSLGKPHGFDDPTQGNLFFEIKRILQDKRPLAFLLENVKNLKSHDKGNTYKVIRDALEKDLGYTIYDEVIDAVSYVPQHRERIFIVGFREPLFFSFPQLHVEKKPTLKDILDPNVPEKYTLTDHLWSYLQKYAEKHRANGNGFGFGLTELNGHTRTLSARYYKDGSEILIPQGKDKNPRRLTPPECARLMGFTQLKPDFKIPVSDTRAYKQFGNAVVVPVVFDIATQIIKTLKKELDNG